jgi:hypothetical protein
MGASGPGFPPACVGCDVTVCFTVGAVGSVSVGEKVG